MKYTVDTHSLVWYFSQDQRLSEKVKNILQEAEAGKDEIIIPAIVLLETIDIQEKKKVEFGLEELFDFIASKNNFTVVDLNFLQIREITKIGKGLDLHDRVVVAVAQFWEAVILTRDSQIKEIAETIW